MSLETILNTIVSSGETELLELKQETETRIQDVLEQADRLADQRRETARQTVLQPVSGESARRTHLAKLKALQIVGTARDEVAAAALAQARRHLIELRAEPEYASILRRLTEDAIRALGEEELNGDSLPSAAPPEAQIDLRDEDILRRILEELDLDMAIAPTLNSWGGVSVRSGDGRVVVTNTFESRLERATPFLRQELAAFFMNSIG